MAQLSFNWTISTQEHIFLRIHLFGWSRSLRCHQQLQGAPGRPAIPFIRIRLGAGRALSGANGGMRPLIEAERMDAALQSLAPRRAYDKYRGRRRLLRLAVNGSWKGISCSSC